MTALSVVDSSTGEGGELLLTLRSPALGRECGVTLLTPDGWTPSKKYPLLYFFHGSSDVRSSVVERTALRSLASKSNVLVALPDGGRMGFYTDWRVPDREGTVPKWETFHLGELLPLLEADYGASDVRMAAGLSMGGYGALRYTMRHPGLFRAAASLSGFTHLTRRGTAALLGTLAVREGMRPGRIWGPRRYAAESWAANDPHLHAEKFAGTEVYLAAGNGKRVPGEEFVAGMELVERFVRGMADDLVDTLRAAGAHVTTDLGPGIHFWTTFAREIDNLWPYVEKNLLSERP